MLGVGADQPLDPISADRAPAYRRAAVLQSIRPRTAGAPVVWKLVSSSGLADPPTGAGAVSGNGWRASALSAPAPSRTMRATDGTGPSAVFRFTKR